MPNPIDSSSGGDVAGTSGDFATALDQLSLRTRDLEIGANNFARAMTSANYKVNWDSINSGGTDFSTSTNYKMHDTVGEQAVGYSTSTNYRVQAGYRQADDLIPTLKFNLGVQENLTQTAYTSISTTTNQVVLVSTLGYATGSFIGVVEDVGLAQKFVVGRIATIIGNTITVDNWEGMVTSISDTPVGGDDFAYRMDGHDLQFGILSSDTPKTGIVVTEVSTSAVSGYTLRIQSDGYLRTSAIHHIMDVTDDTVSLGSEEYGARVYGTTASSTGLDFAVSSTRRCVQEGMNDATDERVGMVYKVAIINGTPGGNYTQVVRYLLTPRF